jgi:hypothetical protein
LNGDVQKTLVTELGHQGQKELFHDLITSEKDLSVLRATYGAGHRPATNEVLNQYGKILAKIPQKYL